MITHARRGQRVRIHYAKSYAHTMPHHGALGRVVLPNRAWTGRNHLVELDDGRRVTVPAGNLVEHSA